MAWTLLPTNYTDASWSGLKQYAQVNNADGTVSFQDVTVYTGKETSFFGALDANNMNEAINTIMSMVENGTDLYTAFQSYFSEQQTLFEATADTTQQEFEAYVSGLREEGDGIILVLQNDYYYDMENFKETQEQLFTAWFEFVKSQLSNDPAGTLLTTITEHVDSDVASETGVHNLRYYEGSTQTYDGTEWVDIGGDSTTIQMQDGKTLETAYTDMLASLSSAQTDLTLAIAQINALSGFNVSGAAATYADLPDASTLAVGTLYVVQADETHSGKTTVYEVVSSSGTNTWTYLSDMEINLDDYVAKTMLGAANGVASLGSDGKLPGGQVPNLPVIGFGYGTCATAAGTAAKVGVLTGFVLKAGSQVALKFTNADTSTNPTLNVNSTGAKPIFYDGARITAGMITAGRLAEFVYDGTNWNLVNPVLKNGFFLRTNFTPTFAGQAFTVTGADFTYNGVVPAGLKEDVVVPYDNTLYTVSSNGYSGSVMTPPYAVTVDNGDPVLANNGWAHIGEVVASGYIPNGWKIGDEKDVTLTTGEVLTFQIYDFNHDDLASGGTARITFGMKNLMAEALQMNSTATNAGSFTGSALYAWLQNDLYNSLPTELTSVIKMVNKKTSAGNKSSTITTSAMNLFLFAECEMRFHFYSPPGEGSQYPIFTDDPSRSKYLSNGEGAGQAWWTRSPWSASSSAFVHVTTSGSFDVPPAATSRLGVCFGFCI